MPELSITETLRKQRLLPVCIMISSIFFLDAGGWARLRVVEKETYDEKTDTHTYKYNNLPEWSEYALGTLVGAVWGLVTLSMFVP